LIKNELNNWIDWILEIIYYLNLDKKLNIKIIEYNNLETNINTLNNNFIITEPSVSENKDLKIKNIIFKK